MATETKLPIHGSPIFSPINFDKKPERVEKSKDKLNPVPRKKRTQSTQVVSTSIHPKQLLLNFFEWRTGIEYCYYDDGNFHTIEVICANEPASNSLMHDLVKLPNDVPFHYHFSPRNNRLKVYIDKDL